MFVCDAVNSTIHMLTYTDDGYTIGESFHGPFKGSVLLASTSDAVFAIDCDACKVAVFDWNGIFNREFDARMNGGPMKPAAIAVSQGLGLLALCDSSKCSVSAFSLEGKLRRFWGSEGNQKGQFVRPSGIAIDESALQVIVADTGNDRIQAFDCESLGTIVWILDIGVSAPSFVATGANHLLWGEAEGIRRYRLRDEEMDRSEGSSCEEAKQASSVHDIPVAKQSRKQKQPRTRHQERSSPHHERQRRAARQKGTRNQKKKRDNTKVAKNMVDGQHSKVESDHKDLRTLQDELTMLEEMEAESATKLETLIRKQVDLDSELSVLNELQGTFESEIALSRLNLRDASNTSHPILKLASAEDVSGCTDKLALEEKHLELKILQKNAAKELPELEETVIFKAQQVESLEEELSALRQQLNALPKTDKLGSSELTIELESHRATIMEQEKSQTDLTMVHDEVVKEKVKQKEIIYGQLQAASDTLRRSRQEAKKLTLRCEILGNKAIELEKALSELESVTRGNGEKSMREVLESSFAKVDKTNGGKLDAEGIVEAYRLVGEEFPAYQEILKAVDSFAVSKYLDIAGFETHMMELDQFIDAFYDITS